MEVIARNSFAAAWACLRPARTVISKNSDGELKVSGDLTIRGVTRNVVFDLEAPSPT
jgi:hypothetical protein